MKRLINFATLSTLLGCDGPPFDITTSTSRGDQILQCERTYNSPATGLTEYNLKWIDEGQLPTGAELRGMSL
ncbi:MAG: hypothetical protein Q8Q35_00965 [Nanoarchaeota archaeon]|nr:hypothetical protein [Nanoarchaeota archaeon]